MLDELVNLTDLLWEVNCELIALENNGLKDSEKWQEKIRDYQNMIQLEAKMYLNITPKEAQDFLKYFSSFDDFETDLKCILDSNTIYLLKRRIENKLFKIVNKSSNISLNENDMVLYQVNELKNWVIEDLASTILSLINQYFTKDLDKETKNYLEEIKYRLSFIYPFIEEDLLQNNYNINPELYWKSKSLGEILDLSYLQEDLVDYNASIIPIVIFEQNHRDSTYSQEIFYQILMRAFFLFINDEEEKQKIYHIFKDFLDNFTFTSDNQKYAAIAETIAYYNEDRELPKIVSFSKQK